MSVCCSGGCPSPPAAPNDRYRRVLWTALWINALMFVVELAGGWRAGSVSLLADAIDFLGDAANYGLSLAALGMAAVWRSRTALSKGVTMGLYGMAIIGRSLWAMMLATVPEASTMGMIGVMALLANGGVALLLFAYRQGDANMRSVWLCTRNDAIGNLAVLLAAAGVFGTGAGWPDLVVACGMGLLSMSAGYSVVRHSLSELRQASLNGSQRRAL